MSRYSSSKFRMWLLVVLIGAAMFTLGHTGFAQETAAPGQAAPGGAAPAQTRNPFSIILDNMDWVFGIIILLSIAGVTLIIQGLIANRKDVFMPPVVVEKIRNLIDTRQFDELVRFTAEDRSFLSRSLHPALKRAPDAKAMKEALETSVSEQSAEQFRRIEYLNIIGNLGPLLGLLGTVLGMIEAFQQMNLAGGAASPGQLAGGISKALAHTFLGLLLAVPCLAAFGVLRTMVDRLTVQGALTAEEMLNALIGSENKTVILPPRPTTPAARTATVNA